uniref:Uncharacterized protein n=1 Tax=Pipistrellus kuhlii TaxID=59472 RepID=A0A7J7XBL7_PIPKU|nr:hypothetical protein mPipKuh1_010570 [Pipistrellus kuhlii]
MPGPLADGPRTPAARARHSGQARTQVRARGAAPPAPASAPRAALAARSFLGPHGAQVTGGPCPPSPPSTPSTSGCRGGSSLEMDGKTRHLKSHEKGLEQTGQASRPCLWLRRRAQRHARGSCRQRWRVGWHVPKEGSSAGTRSDPQPGLRQPVVRARHHGRSARRGSGGPGAAPALTARFSGVPSQEGHPLARFVHGRAQAPHCPGAWGGSTPSSWLSKWVSWRWLPAGPQEPPEHAVLPLRAALGSSTWLSPRTPPEGAEVRGHSQGGHGVCRWDSEPDDPSGLRCGEPGFHAARGHGLLSPQPPEPPVNASGAPGQVRRQTSEQLEVGRPPSRGSDAGAERSAVLLEGCRACSASGRAWGLVLGRGLPTPRRACGQAVLGGKQRIPEPYAV